MADTLDLIVDALKDLRDDVRQVAATQGEMDRERSRARDENREFQVVVITRLDRLDAKADYTNGKVDRGAQLDERHTAAAADLGVRVTALERPRAVRHRVFAALTARARVWAALAASTALTVAVTFLVTRALTN